MQQPTCSCVVSCVAFFKKSKSLDNEELHFSSFKARHVASGARLVTAVNKQSRECNDVHADSGSRLLTAVWPQERVSNEVHMASGPRQLTALQPKKSRVQ